MHVKGYASVEQQLRQCHLAKVLSQLDNKHGSLENRNESYNPNPNTNHIRRIINSFTLIVLFIYSKLGTVCDLLSKEVSLVDALSELVE